MMIKKNQINSTIDKELNYVVYNKHLYLLHLRFYYILVFLLLVQNYRIGCLNGQSQVMVILQCKTFLVRINNALVIIYGEL